MATWTPWDATVLTATPPNSPPPGWSCIKNLKVGQHLAGRAKLQAPQLGQQGNGCIRASIPGNAELLGQNLDSHVVSYPGRCQQILQQTAVVRCAWKHIQHLYCQDLSFVAKAKVLRDRNVSGRGAGRAHCLSL